MPRRVEVEWVDSIALNEGEWGTKEEHGEWLAPEKRTIRSCGYLYLETDDAIILALSYHDYNGNAANVMLIPTCAIKSIFTLAEKGEE